MNTDPAIAMPDSTNGITLVGERSLTTGALVFADAGVSLTSTDHDAGVSATINKQCLEQHIGEGTQNRKVMAI